MCADATTARRSLPGPAPAQRQPDRRSTGADGCSSLLMTFPMRTTLTDTVLAPSSDRTSSGSTGQKRWLLALLVLALLLRLWRLEQNGFGTDYYSAGVRSMMTGWHRFFYNAFDPGGFVSLDKPPVALWIQVLSAKLLGFHGLAVLLPQVLEGVAAVWLLFYLVERRFGSTAGLLAGFFLAITPVSVASDRSSNIDSCLVLVLLLAAWALIKATETGSRGPLLLSMALVGLGFNVKMLAAFVVLPAFALAHSLGTRLPWRRLIADWGVASLVLASVSLSWVLAFDLTPVDRRPFAGSSTGNSMLELVVGHNGVGRFVRRARPAPPIAGDPLAASAPSAPPTAGATIGPGPGGGRPPYLVRAPVGPLRLADRRLAAQVAWFVPLAVVGILAGASRAHRRWPLDGTRTDLLLWSGWVVAYGVVYSYAGGIFHYYYLATLGPPLAALAGVGLATSWDWDWAPVLEQWRGDFTSRPPAPEIVVCTTLSISSSLERSHGTAMARPPFALMSLTSASSRSLRRALATTIAPSSAKRRAVPWPAPELAPVTMATRSCRIPMFLS